MKGLCTPLTGMIFWCLKIDASHTTKSTISECSVKLCYIYIYRIHKLVVNQQIWKRKLWLPDLATWGWRKVSILLPETVNEHQDASKGQAQSGSCLWSQYFGRPRWENCLSPGVRDQLRQQRETPSLQKNKNKLSGCGAIHLWSQILRSLRITWVLQVKTAVSCDWANALQPGQHSQTLPQNTGRAWVWSQKWS